MIKKLIKRAIILLINWMMVLATPMWGLVWALVLCFGYMAEFFFYPNEKLKQERSGRKAIWK